MAVVGGAMVILVSQMIAQADLGSKLTFLAWTQSVVDRRLAIGAEESSLIEGLHLFSRSEPIDWSPGFPLIVKDVESAPEAVPLLIEIPDSVDRPLVILRPSESGPLGLQALVVEDSPASFPWGSFRIFNATARPLDLVTRSQLVKLQPGWEPTDFSLSGDQNESVVITIEDSNRERRIVYSTIWTAGPDTRRLVFILPSQNPRLGLIELRVIPEFSDQGKS